MPNKYFNFLLAAIPYIFFSIHSVNAQSIQLIPQLNSDLPIKEFKVSKNERYILVQSMSVQAQIWDLKIGKVIRNLSLEEEESIVDISSNGETFITYLDGKRTFKVRNTINNEILFTYQSRYKESMYNTEGDKIFTLSSRDSISIANSTTGQLETKFKIHIHDNNNGVFIIFDRILEIEPDRYGTSVKVLSAYYNDLFIYQEYNINPNVELINSVSIENDNFEMYGISFVSFNFNTMRFVQQEYVPSKERKEKGASVYLHIYEHDGRERKIAYNNTAFTNVLFNKEGDWIITGDKARRIKIWDVNTGEQLYELNSKEAFPDEPSLLPKNFWIIDNLHLDRKNSAIYYLEGFPPAAGNTKIRKWNYLFAEISNLDGGVSRPGIVEFLTDSTLLIAKDRSLEKLNLVDFSSSFTTLNYLNQDSYVENINISKNLLFTRNSANAKDLPFGLFSSPLEVWNMENNSSILSQEGPNHYTYSEQGNLYSYIENKMIREMAEGMGESTNTMALSQSILNKLVKMANDSTSTVDIHLLKYENNKVRELETITTSGTLASVLDFHPEGKGFYFTSATFPSLDINTYYGPNSENNNNKEYKDALYYYDLVNSKLSKITQNVADVKYAPHGDFLCRKYNDQSIEIVNPENHQVIRRRLFLGKEVNLVGFIPGNQFLLSDPVNRKTFVWNFITDTLKEIEGFTNEVIASPSQEFILMVNDYSFTLWDKDLQKMYFTRLQGNAIYDNLMLTPDNYYWNKGNADQQFAFTYQNKAYLFDQFDLQYHRPDQVLRASPFADSLAILTYKKAYEKRLENAGILPQQLTTDLLTVPEVSISTENGITSTSEEEILLNVQAKSNGLELMSLNIFVNNVPIYGRNGKPLQGKKELNTSYSIPLSHGINKIEVSVTSKNGDRSLRDVVNILCKKENVRSKIHLITIGVSKYDDDALNLAYAAKDAENLSDLFSEKDAVVAYTLLDKKATRKNILLLKEKLQSTSVDDKVILYFAGHGFLDENLEFYLGTYDIDYRNPSNNGLAYEDFEDFLDNIPARQKLMLIDACHSGEVDKENTELIALGDSDETRGIQVYQRGVKPLNAKAPSGLQNSFSLMKELFADVRRGTGATVISSAGGAEYAYEGKDWKNGVFTYCLLRGLSQMEADENQDGKVTVSEIQAFVANEVPALTDGKQQPTYRIENITNDWVIWE